jgi:hypothetical protein
MIFVAVYSNVSLFIHRIRGAFIIHLLKFLSHPNINRLVRILFNFVMNLKRTFHDDVCVLFIFLIFVCYSRIAQMSCVANERRRRDVKIK